jgi:hypothetical protein
MSLRHREEVIKFLEELTILEEVKEELAREDNTIETMLKDNHASSLLRGGFTWSDSKRGGKYWDMVDLYYLKFTNKLD